jgi:lipoate-protein ligase A
LIITSTNDGVIYESYTWGLELLSGRVLDYETDDLYYNLALEHTILLLHSKSQYSSTVRFWKNPKSVIVGRNQLVEEEIDTDYCHKNNILIGRRISGGGAVYHDPGNLNISFFASKKNIPKNLNMTEITEFFTDLLIEILKNSLPNLSEIERKGSSNILHRGKKISGSAGYLRNNWVLHHATILYSVDLENLEKSLLARLEKPTIKRKSEYYPTTNLPNFNYERLKESTIEVLKMNLRMNFNFYGLTRQEKVHADKLSVDMYSQPSWIFDRKRDMI